VTVIGRKSDFDHLTSVESLKMGRMIDMAIKPTMVVE